MLIDSHCHLEPKDFGDERDAVIARAREAGVGGLICIGSGGSLDEVRNAVSLAERHDHIWAGIGIHPHDAARVPEGALAELECLAGSHPRVVAVGETGLDAHYDHSPLDAQEKVMREIVRIGRRTKKPVSFHIRDAHPEARKVLAEENIAELGGVIHCFTGDLWDAQAYVEMGLCISFSGIITFKNAGEIREACAWLPLDRMLIETDCPYLAPVPLRGKRNEPAYLVHTARFIADLRGIPLEILAQHTADNTRRLFRLSAS